MAEPAAAKTKMKVEMNSARYARRALGVTDCWKWAVNAVLVAIDRSLFVFLILD